MKYPSQHQKFVVVVTLNFNLNDEARNHTQHATGVFTGTFVGGSFVRTIADDDDDDDTSDDNDKTTPEVTTTGAYQG